jgi:hypothetical protein
MPSNAMSDCCISGVKHEGESAGEYKDIGGGKLSSLELHLLWTQFPVSDLAG